MYITASDNFRSCASVSMVTRREGEGFQVCLWVRVWVKSWQTVRDRHTNSQRNKQSPLLLSAAVITVAPAASYQSESVSTRSEVQNNTDAHPQPVQALLWLIVSQLRATPPAVVHFTALWMRDMGKCQNLDFLFFASKCLSCIVFLNSPTCRCCREQQWNKQHDFATQQSYLQN